MTARRAVLALVTLILSCAVLGACRVDTRVDVDVTENGSGTVTAIVTLDPEAAGQLGDPSKVLTNDLTDAGWQVEAPATDPGGAVTFVARRPFASPEELPAVLDEIAGAGSFIREPSLSATSGQLSTDYAFSGRLVSSGDVGALSDPDLTKVLDGLAVGRTPEELQQLGAADPNAATLTLQVALPGAEPQRWSVPVTGGQTAEVAMSATSSQLSTSRLIPLVLGVALIVLAAVVAVVALVRRRR